MLPLLPEGFPMPDASTALAKAAIEAGKLYFYPADLPPGQPLERYHNATTGAEHDILPPTATCNGYLRRRHGYCSNRAGQFTTHDGTGRCIRHDMSAAHAASRRYRALHDTAIGALAQEIAVYDDDPTNITEELALARALFTDWIKRYQQFSDAIIAWHKSYSSGEGTPKPVRLLDITAADRQIQTIARLALQLEESRLRDALSQGELIAILREVSLATETTVTTCPHCHGSLQPVLEAIKTAWGRIVLWGRRSQGTRG